MEDKDLVSADSLAFLSANRAPGKRQIRVVNREELTSSLVAMIGGGSDDEDDDDFDENQKDDGDSSGDDTSDDGVGSGMSDNDNFGEDTSDDDEAEEDAKATKKTVKQLSDDEDEEEEEEENSNSVGATDSVGAQNSGISTPREHHQDLVQPEIVDTVTANTAICCLCLNFNYGDSEVIQCDNCGMAVHEGCYGIGDDASESSHGSSEMMEPWFCEPCLAGHKPDELSCELCPAKGGAMKRTDYDGHWVHLLCALCVGCSFGDLDRLSPVCLFDPARIYSRFGSKCCAGCQKHGCRLTARTGICAKCDAGMCKVFYHITCAQKAGLLHVNPLHNAEADPNFFLCPRHSDPQTVRIKAKRYQMLESQKSTNPEHSLTPREERVLSRRRTAFAQMVAAKGPNWMPTAEKWQRLLPTSSQLLAKMGQKVEAVEGIGREEWEGEFRVVFNANMLGKFANMPPAFSADFVGYFTEREKQMPTIRDRVEELTKSNNQLRAVQEEANGAFDKADQLKRELDNTLKQEHSALSSICSSLMKLGCKTVSEPKPLVIGSTLSPLNGMNNRHSKSSGAPTSPSSRQRTSGAASRSSLTAIRTDVDEPPIDVVRVRQCAHCGQSHDQHLMAHCDTCGKHYHIACLDPPLTKLPKKSSLYGWECSKCFNRSSNSSDVEADVTAPRQLRVARKPVVRFTSEEVVDEKEFNRIMNGIRPLRRRSAPAPTKRKSSEPVVSHSLNKHNESKMLDTPKDENSGTPIKKIRRAALDGNTSTDHASITRNVVTAVVEANIRKCVDAVIQRSVIEQASKNRLKSESVAEVGLEDEKDDESGSSQGSLDCRTSIKHQCPNIGAIAAGIIGKRRAPHSGGTKRGHNVQVIRVEDLD